MREYIREYFGFDYDKLLTISLSEKIVERIRVTPLFGKLPISGVLF
jgi:hypothetical protein